MVTESRFTAITGKVPLAAFTGFNCTYCNVVLNSLDQLQAHREGILHIHTSNKSTHIHITKHTHIYITKHTHNMFTKILAHTHTKKKKINMLLSPFGLVWIFRSKKVFKLSKIAIFIASCPLVLICIFNFIQSEEHMCY